MSPQTTIAHYRIVSKLGEGGMGEVWRATDTKLNRDVAIKILPEAFANDADRMARFTREAQVLASLNHPNIAAIYGVEERALVMELVEGDNLHGPLPLDTALKYARQIADALEAAHEKGIIHRDLKPANIMVKPDGAIKVLDFGLAKAAAEDPKSDPQNSPTLTLSPTRAGIILGTAAYMSPEQAQGKTVDNRADIWAFGCVLYEMLTGKEAFQGETTADILAAVIKQEPAWEQAPAKVRRLLRSCLEKDSKNRLRDIGDVWLLLEEGPEAPPSPRRLLPWVAAGLLAISLVDVGVSHFREQPAETPVLRFFIAPPEKAIFAGSNAGTTGPPVLSPDGRRLAFVATREDGTRQLWVQSLDALAAQPLAGTEDASYPFWSADSRSLGFFADRYLKKIDASGGPALTLCEAVSGRGGTWNQNGVILFSPGTVTPLYQVSASGGAARQVTSFDTSRQENSHRHPWFLPDGRHFLYTARTGVSRNGWIRIASLDSASDNRTLLASPLPSNAMYANGYLLFTNDGALMAQPLDPKRLAGTAAAVPIAEHVYYDSRGSDAMFSASANGLLLYEAGGGDQIRKLTWFDRTGKQLSSIGNLANLSLFRLAPDGKSVAAALMPGQNQDLWILDIQHGHRTRFTFDPGLDGFPVWSPDGRTIAFGSARRGPMDLYLKPADQTKDEELVYANGLNKEPTSWSADGKFLLYTTVDSVQQRNAVWVLPMAGERTPSPFLQSAQFSQAQGQFSQNGRWVAYQSNESGEAEIYVAPFPGPGPKRQVSIKGGISPAWRPDGREIFYLGPSGNQLMAVEVRENGAILEIGAAHALFGPIFLLPGGRPYDISPDGKQILTTSGLETNVPERLTVVQNWTVGLKR